MRINQYGKNCIKDKVETERKGQDQNRYEIDFQYFKNWFRENETRLMNKIEYFYGPY